MWPLVCEVSEDGLYGGVTLFETLTAMAFVHFREIGADFQVLEVGLGGRLDSTNLVQPEACAITSISLDHTAILGDSVDLIAREKAGIVKTGVPVVSAPQQPSAMEEIRQVCIEKAAQLWEVGRDISLTTRGEDLSGQSFSARGRLGDYGLTMPLLGSHQLENAAVSMGVLECLMERGWEIGTDGIRQGFENVKWPCRLEVLERDPPLLCDGAHNPDSMMRLAGVSSGVLRWNEACGYLWGVQGQEPGSDDGRAGATEAGGGGHPVKASPIGVACRNVQGLRHARD